MQINNHILIISTLVLSNVFADSYTDSLIEMMSKLRVSKNKSGLAKSAKLTKTAEAHVNNMKEFNIRTGSLDWGGPKLGCEVWKNANCTMYKPKNIAEYNSYGYEITFDASESVDDLIKRWSDSKSAYYNVIFNGNSFEGTNWVVAGAAKLDNYGSLWLGDAKDDEVKVNYWKLKNRNNINLNLDNSNQNSNYIDDQNASLSVDSHLGTPTAIH